MRKLWGPLGWMTLHSISALYPDEPTADDKAMLKEFMDIFAMTIVCPHCNEHFREMFSIYTKKYSDWADSKLNLFVFICRAHNTVNRRLDKPIIKTLQDCIETLRVNTITTSSREFRTKYIDYITKSWIRDRNDGTVIFLSKCSRLSKINSTYWNNLPQEVKFEYLPDIDVTENIGKATSGPYTNVYISGNLSFLKRAERHSVTPVQTYSVSQPVKIVAEQPQELPRVRSQFRPRNGKLTLVHI
jgi:hypothetical protein